MSAKSQRLQQSQLVYVTHSLSRVYIYCNLHILCVQHEGFVSVGNIFADCYTQTFITETFYIIQFRTFLVNKEEFLPKI